MFKEYFIKIILDLKEKVFIFDKDINDFKQIFGHFYKE